MNMTVLVKLDEGAFMPERANLWDAGMDLRTPVGFTVKAHNSATVDTGVHIGIPRYYVGKLESKSGLNVKHDIIGTGVIDSGYTGSIVVKLYNLGDNDYTFERGDKIIQLLIQGCSICNMYEVEKMAETERGENGFGSTGR